MSTQAKSIKGSHCRDCKVFCSNIDPEAMKMVKELLDNPHSEGNKVRIMPDVHLGKGIVIGFTGLMGTHVNPSHIGLDIGCGIDTELFDRPLDPKDYALFEHRLNHHVICLL